MISTNGLAVCSNLNFTIDNIVSSYSSDAVCSVGGNNDTPIHKIPFYQMFNETKTIFGTVHLPMYYYFRVNYYTTLLSCTMGIVKFLDVGPTKILPTQGWRNYVFYALAVLSVFTSLHTKALGLGQDGVLMDTILSSFGICAPSWNTTLNKRKKYSYFPINSNTQTSNKIKIINRITN